MSNSTTGASIIERLDAALAEYEGENVWEDVIFHLCPDADEGDSDGDAFVVREDDGWVTRFVYGYSSKAWSYTQHRADAPDT